MKRPHKSMFLTITVLFFSSLLTGCLKESPEQVELTVPVFDTEGSIGPAGGVVRIMDENSPIHGCYVAIKEDALNRFVNISIRQVDSPDTTLSDSGRVFVEFLPAGTVFNKPVEIGIVYENGHPDSVQQFVYDEELQKWLPIPFRRLDQEKKIVVGETPHFSTYSVLNHTRRTISFPDPGLEQAVREATALYDNQPISLGDVYYVTGLDAADYGITDLTGIGHL
ncbi:MAG: hypothetical protein ACLFQB_13665, partial [Chitinispirillaceae bacterium]